MSDEDVVNGDEVRHTIREFSGTLTFDTPVETRTYLRRLVVVWSRDLACRSAMHSAYRAKTRRRNRRRK